MKKYLDVTGDASIITTNKNKFLLLLDTLEAYYNPDDKLTVAMPPYPVYYLMDNSEVVAGLEDMLTVLETVTPEEREATSRCTTLLAEIKLAIEQKLWDSSHQHYNYALGEMSDLENGDFYPSTLCQIYPIIYRTYENTGQTGLNSRIYQLYNKFCYYAPAASDLSYVGTPTPHVEVMLYAWQMAKLSPIYNKLDITIMYNTLEYLINSDKFWYCAHDAGLFLNVLQQILDD